MLGLDYGKHRSPDLMETWNGKKPIYIFNGDHVPIGITTDVDPESKEITQRELPASGIKIKKQKTRKKMTKKSKIKNRKKK